MNPTDRPEYRLYMSRAAGALVAETRPDDAQDPEGGRWPGEDTFGSREAAEEWLAQMNVKHVSEALVRFVDRAIAPTIS